MDNLPRIPDEEFKLRIEKFKNKMEANSIDFVYIYSNLGEPSSVRYFSDFYPINESSSILIPLKGEPILCSGHSGHEWSRHKSRIDDVRILSELGEPFEYTLEDKTNFETLFKEIKSKYKDIKRIGIIGESIIPHLIYKKLERVFPGIDKINVEDFMWDLRKVKSEKEIECIRKSGEISSISFEHSTSRLKAGITTELDIHGNIENRMLALGAEDHCVGFSIMVASGKEHSNLCMNRNTLRKIQEAEIINIQGGALYEGYNSIICTPVVLGNIPSEIKKTVRVMYEAQKLLVDYIKPRVNSKNFYTIYNNFLKEEGYLNYSPIEGAVHSIGMLEVDPLFSPTRDIFIEENMAIAIDIYFKGFSWGSTRIEDTFIIGKKGAEQITSINIKNLKKFI